MEKRDIEAFKKELMKLYSASTSKVQPKPVEAQPEETIAECDEASNIQEYESEETNSNDTEEPTADEGDTDSFPEEDISDERFPDPDLSGLEGYDEPELHQEESLGDAAGYILINVRTGHEAFPIAGASVVITSVNDGKRFLIASGETDISGVSGRFQVPAPDREFSQHPDSKVRPYSLFDISVRAEGYYNARSVDVPVFAGETSIQTFNMIPLPIGAESDDETLIINNS